MINQPTYTQCPNVFFDEILKELSGSETKVFCVIMRKTFGWQKSKDRISYSQIMEMSGISSKATVSDAIKSLETKGIVIAEREKQTTVYSVNVSESEPVQKMNRYENRTTTGTIIEPSLPETGTITVHTKESNLNKLSKEIYIEIDNSYVETYKELKGNDPIIIYPSLRKRQKTLLESGITKDKLISAIKEAKHDSWIVSHGFDILTILSDKVLPRLINTSRYSLPSKPLSPKEKLLCPRCGAEVIAGLCTKCRIPVDSDGKELK